MSLYEQLQDALERAAFDAFKQSALRLRGETFYCASLYTSDGYGYVCDTVSTIEGLKTVAERYFGDGSYRTLEETMQRLKWSPCDSPYHIENEHLFTECNRIIDEIWGAIDFKNEEEADRAYRELHTVFVAVLRKIRAANIFDPKCVITLLAGDQSDEARVANTEEINPPEVSRALLADLKVDGEHLARLRKNRWPTDNYYEP